MIAFRRWLLALLALSASVSPVKARDIHLELPALQLNTLSAVSLGAPLPSAITQAVANAAPLPALPPPPFETSSKERRQLKGAGFGLAAGIGLTVSGLLLASFTRPNQPYSGKSICYEDPEREKQLLYIGSGVMAAGITLSSGMVSWLVGLRRAHPELRMRAGTRVLQAVTGFGVASVTAAIFTATAIGCMSS